MTNLDQIIDKATDILGSEDRALDWVDKVSATLGSAPRGLSESQEGTEAVLLHLNTISRHSLT